MFFLLQVIQRLVGHIAFCRHVLQSSACHSIFSENSSNKTNFVPNPTPCLDNYPELDARWTISRRRNETYAMTSQIRTGIPMVLGTREPFFIAPNPLPILSSSNGSPQLGFPVVNTFIRSYVVRKIWKPLSLYKLQVKLSPNTVSSFKGVKQLYRVVNNICIA